MIDRQTDNCSTKTPNFQECNKRNIAYITFLQSFALVLVIIGHCLPKVNNGDITPIWSIILHQFVYSFHMPLFFILGGFLLAHSFYKNSKTIQSFSNFFINKLKRLIIPYISIGTLAYLLKVFVFNKFAYRPVEPSFTFYLKSLLIPWDNPNIYLWFLPTMFIILMIYFFIFQKQINFKTIFLTFLISIFSGYIHIEYLNISGVLYYLFFFTMGGYIYWNREEIFKRLLDMKMFLFISLVFIFLLIFNNSAIILLNKLYTVLIALCGIFLSFIISLLSTKYNKKFCFGILDGKYYQIYLLSWFFQAGIRIFYQIHLVNYTTVCIMMFIGSIVLPLLITSLIKKYIPQLKIFIGL